MATSNDHPGLPFVQAQGYTRGRPDGPPIWVVIHDMEAGENPQRAESTADYFANPPDGRQVSSHYCVDSDSVVQCVDLDDVAWTVGNRPGNNRGLNWELSGFASQTREQWLDPFGIAMFQQLAPICASDMKRFNIPNRWCTAADLQARRPGLTTHNDLRIAFGGTSHSDPGSGFPFDYLQQVLELALNQGVHMPKIIKITDPVPAPGLGYPDDVVPAGALYATGGSGFHHLGSMTVLNNYAYTWSIATKESWTGTLAAAYDGFGPFLGKQDRLVSTATVSGVTIGEVDARIAKSTIHPPATTP